MTRTICKLYLDGEYRVTRDDSAKNNPYRVTYTWRELTEYGLRKHTKQLARYGNLDSCMCHLREITRLNDCE